MGFGPTYVAHTPPLRGWHSRDSLCYGAGARVACGLHNYKMHKKKCRGPWAVRPPHGLAVV